MNKEETELSRAVEFINTLNTSWKMRHVLNASGYVCKSNHYEIKNKNVQQGGGGGDTCMHSDSDNVKAPYKSDDPSSEGKYNSNSKSNDNFVLESSSSS